MEQIAENQMGRIEALLGQVRLLSQHYRDLARATGEEFNIFRTIHVGHYEARTHTPLLAELLRPMGSHGQGTAFLELFLDRLGKCAPAGFDAKSATVDEEYHLGPRTNEEGGRIDILIRDGKNNCIGIENKIFAADQENQMPRYRASLGKNAVLIYLTLDGGTPEKGKMDSKMLTMSYKKDIRDWLEVCRRTAVTAPVLREGLSHYLHLVLWLTDQNSNQEMTNRIIETILASREQLSAFGALDEIRGPLWASLVKDLNQRLGECIGVDSRFVEKGVKVEGFFSESEKEKSGFYISTRTLRDLGLWVGVAFDTQGWNQCSLVICLSRDPYDGRSDRWGWLHKAFREEFGDLGKPADCWAAWKHWDQLYSWTWETWIEAKWGGLIERIVDELSRLVQVAESGP